MRQIEVINLETIIDVTAETSNVEILVKDYDSELVERFALEAQEAAIDAEESADIANAQASIATAQAGIATTQAGIATTQAGIATTQSGIATTKANEASASAASALASEQAADADRILAQTAATTATTQAGIATTQAGIATTKAGEASASADDALASQNSASGSASTATTQAGIATTQAGIATTQAGIATTQAGNALTSANNAAASAAAAAQVGTSTLLTGFSTGANSTILATDTILQGFNKTQGQINARVAGTIATGQVAFGTAANTVGGSNNLFWDNSNGRLGIGTSTFPTQLTITNNNPITFDNNTHSGENIFIRSSGIGAGINNPTSMLAFGKNDGSSLRTGAAIVGIQTTDDADQVGLAFYTSRTTGSSQTLAEAWRITSTGILQSNGAQTIQTSTGNLTLATAGGNGNILLSPNGTGNVGVNFATPNAKLESRATALIASVVDGNAGIRLSNTQTSAILMLGQGTAGVSLIQAARTSDNTAQLLSLQTYGGNVFIGSTPTDAGFRLDVNGTARVQGVLTTTADAVVNGVNVGLGGGAVSTNVRVGNSALNANTTGLSNTAIGFASLFANTTGNQNTSIGRNTFLSNTTGGGNTAIGFQAGTFISDGTTPLTVSANSIFIGANSRANAVSETNQIVIGHTAIGLGSNTTVIGNTSTTFGRWFGNLLIGTSTNSTFALDVNGTARVSGTVANALTVQRTTATSNIYIRYQNATNSWYAGQTDTGSFGIGTDAALGGGILFNLTTGGNLLLGTVTNAASSILTMQSTTQGFLPPRMTTTQKNAIASPATGLVVYDNTLNKLSVFTGATWETVTSL